MDNQRGLKLKIIITWLAILLMGSFWLTARTSSDPVNMAVVPEVPREGEPVIATVKLNNPTLQPASTEFQFYANGELVKEGISQIPAGSSLLFQYAYENALPLGEQVNFVARTGSSQGRYERAVSLPAYPPQIWSSFVSFASFSTSVMSFMVSMSYYEGTFGATMGFNVGLLSALVLIFLLIFLELTQPVIQRRMHFAIKGLRLRFSTVTWILFIIFIGIVYTRIAMALAT